jgi:hypothetical protein
MAFSLPVGQPSGALHLAREAKGRVLVTNLKRVGGTARSRLVTFPARPWSAGRSVSLRRAVESARGKGTGSRSHGFVSNALERPKSPREYRPARARARGRVRILAGSNALESRGIMISWSSEQENVMSETTRGPRRRKAYGSAGGKSSEG